MEKCILTLWAFKITVSTLTVQVNKQTKKTPGYLNNVINEPDIIDMSNK